MKEAIRLAFRNLWGAGIRTWLNAGVLAFSLIIVIFFTGLIDGWNEESRREGIAWEYAEGHLYHKDFDLLDAFTYLDGHGVLPQEEQVGLTPVLFRSITLYPQGRMVSALLKGIPTDQNVVKLPTASLDTVINGIPVMVGSRMADLLKVEVGDEIMMRWRDKYGAYDAQTVTIVKVFDCIVPGVDGGQIWMSLDKMAELTAMQGEASYFLADEDFDENSFKNDDWKYSDKEVLLKPMTDVINTKKSSGVFLYMLFLGIGLLAIFDTQVLSIFRRQKEIGTYIALGMTRWQVVRIFTFEGVMYSFFAVILAAVFGTPLLWLIAKVGYPMPGDASDYGMIMSNVIYPVYGLGLVVKSALSLMIFATLISFLPARKITKLNPILALKGKAF